MTRASEDDLIARYFAPLAGPAGLGLRDDAAVLAVEAGFELVVTKDVVVAGVHFFPDDPASSIAQKALRVNLSDLAAKRSRPLGFLLGLMLPHHWTEAWLERFVAGLGEDVRAFRCPLMGGDTVSTPGPLCLSITAFGEVPRGGMLPRTTARPGDLLYVSGTIGDAALGLQLRLHGDEPPAWGKGLGSDQRGHLLDRYLHPKPRTALREALAHARAGMDVSDGLVGDLTKMMRVSGVSARVDLARVPLSGAANACVAAEAAALTVAVTGGDDYEILAAVPPEAGSAFEAEATRAGVAVYCIGEVTAGAGVPVFRDSAGGAVAFSRGSYSHY